MQTLLAKKFSGTCGITKIVPNFFRNKIRQRDYLGKLNKLYAGRVTTTVIPYDPVFDMLVTERKILFMDFLHSRVTSFYVKLMHELFELDEDRLWQMTIQHSFGRTQQQAVSLV
jgi:hypothetical protein